MPSLKSIANALRQYRRYGVISAYVDDVDELRDGTFLQNEHVKLFKAPPAPVWHLVSDGELLVIYLNAPLGLVQLRLTKQSPTTTVSLSVDDPLRAQLAETINVATTAAKHAKQGHLGDLVLCMLIGNHVPGPAGPVGLRIFAIQHIRGEDRWHAYDGTLLAWAKEHLVHDPT